MNKYAIIHNGFVVNIIEYENQPSTPPAGFEDGYVAVKTDAASIGWTYTNGAFTDPNPPEITEMPAPKSLTDLILESPTELAKLKQALGIA
jgi:hypothetical protein